MRVEEGAMSYLFLARRRCKKDKTDGTIKQIFTSLWIMEELSQKS
jgi:hypothetical protein